MVNARTTDLGPALDSIRTILKSNFIAGFGDITSNESRDKIMNGKTEAEQQRILNQ